MRRLLRSSGISVSLVQPGFVERGEDSAWHQRALATGTTTPAIFHAATSARPQTRYPCAAAYGLPARIIAGLVPLIPDPLLDAMVALLESAPAPERKEL
mmetsp:Transcript_129112/g.359489  ORF Transcript_129112/g.359489 Transcript_129112/m.359489 type:complete len:99 (-) Transcript_129112:105-401(-)